MQFTADALENSRVLESNGELEFVTSAANKIMLRPDDLQQALKRIASRPMRIKVTVGEVGAQQAVARPTEDDATARALANPEVQRFREVFGGEIRKVRNLKE
jgi:DNA polymerase III subunit gamma/tau